jgi:hypothetical protein
MSAPLRHLIDWQAMNRALAGLGVTLENLAEKDLEITAWEERWHRRG